MRSYIKGAVDLNMDLGTLAAKTLVSKDFANVMAEKGRITSVELAWAMEGFTEGANIGPIYVGIAHNDYSDAEMEAVIENTGSWNPGDKVKQEVAKRLVRVIGVFKGTHASLGVVELNDGRPIKTKLNWEVITGQTLAVWAYNAGSAAIGTTDPNVVSIGHANIFMDR